MMRPIDTDPIGLAYAAAPRALVLAWTLLGCVVPVGVAWTLGGAAGAVLGALGAILCSPGLVLMLGWVLPGFLAGRLCVVDAGSSYGPAVGYVTRQAGLLRRSQDRPFLLVWQSAKSTHTSGAWAAPGLLVVRGHPERAALDAALRRVQQATVLGPVWVTACLLDGVWAAASGHPGPLAADASSWRPSGD